MRTLTIIVRVLLFFFFNDTATTEIYTLSLHDALPIFELASRHGALPDEALAHELAGEFELARGRATAGLAHLADRKSTRLNSSHSQISYAVFCLKKKKKLSTTIPCTTTLPRTTIALPP